MRDKRGKFVQLANQRVTKALEQIRLVGNLANKSSYDFTEEDAKKIIKALQKAVDSTKNRFLEYNGGSESGFSLE